MISRRGDGAPDGTGGLCSHSSLGALRIFDVLFAQLFGNVEDIVYKSKGGAAICGGAFAVKKGRVSPLKR